MKIFLLAVFILSSTQFVWAESLSQSSVESQSCQELLAKKTNFSVPYHVTEDGRIETKSMAQLVRFFYPLLSITKLELVTTRLAADNRADVPYWLKLSQAFGQSADYDEAVLQQIPRVGPLVIIANHPLNGVEGIAIAAMISRVRPDMKVALTPLLLGIPGMVDNAIFVNPYGGRAAAQANIVAREEMRQHLKSGGALLIFPSGEVSVREKLFHASVRDNDWKTGVVKLLRQTPGAQVLPIFVEGQTSFSFQVAKRVEQKIPPALSKIKMIMTMVMHIREVAAQVDRNVDVVVGPTVRAEDVLNIGGDNSVIEKLRLLTYGLQDTK